MQRPQQLGLLLALAALLLLAGAGGGGGLGACAAMAAPAPGAAAAATSNSSRPTTTKYCQYDQPCWPSDADIAALRAALEPELPRRLVWQPGTPRISAVPVGSPGQQSLYGAGANLSALTVLPASQRGQRCDFKPPPALMPVTCVPGTRNNPTTTAEVPAFVAYPLKTSHVVALVKFAAKHSLCIAVAGTGHDFLNRHSCRDRTAPALLVRTTLLKSMSFNEADTRGPAGTVTLGAGVVFAEAEAAADTRKRYIACGWAPTVGVIGWSLGGGHGPAGAAAGLGVDNVVGVQLVTASGEAVTANATSNSDLFWALRGSGGATWGIVTAITLKLHPAPKAWTNAFFYFTATADAARLRELEGLVRSYLDWSLALPASVSAMLNFSLKPLPGTAAATGANGTAPAHAHSGYGGGAAKAGAAPTSPPVPAANTSRVAWMEGFVALAYQGSPGDDVFKRVLANFSALPDNKWTSIKSFPSMYAMRSSDEEFIMPTPWLGPLIPDANVTGGVSSVLLNRSAVASPAFRTAVAEHIQFAANNIASGAQSWPNNWQFYTDVTGRPDSPPRDGAAMSVSAGMRSALIHLVVPWLRQSRLESTYYRFGANSYFSESAYFMPGWQQRYWGAETYNRLLQVKAKWDPKGLFGCRHCVGDDGAA